MSHQRKTNAMKRIILAAVLATASTSVALAQQPARPAPPPGAPPRGMEGRPVGSGSIPIHEHPSNTQSNVETDRFIGTPGHSFSKVWNGMMTRSMLRGGNPYVAGESGAVLEYRDDLAVATVEPHGETGTAASPEIFFYYVQGGSGRVDTGQGTKAYDVRPGVGVLINDGVKQHFVNTGDQPLSMIMLTWKNNDGLKVKQDIKVIDTNTEPLGTNRAHWVMTGKHMFDNADGINITTSAIRIPPVSYSGPHAHTKGVEEIWVKTGFDTGYAVLGSEMRKIVGPGAFLAPPNGLTTHSSMNLNEDKASTWLYLSRRAPNDPAAQ